VLCSLQRTYTFSLIHQPELLMSFVSQEQCFVPIRPHICQKTGRNEMPESVSAAWGARIDSLVQVQRFNQGKLCRSATATSGL
jgi:hypothetical protein